jgi:hypothetical protein
MLFDPLEQQLGDLIAVGVPHHDMVSAQKNRFQPFQTFNRYAQFKPFESASWFRAFQSFQSFKLWVVIVSKWRLHDCSIAQIRNYR